MSSDEGITTSGDLTSSDPTVTWNENEDGPIIVSLKTVDVYRIDWEEVETLADFHNVALPILKAIAPPVEEGTQLYEDLEDYLEDEPFDERYRT